MRYSREAKDFVKKVQRKFEIHDLGFPTEVLDMQLRKTTYGLHLSTKQGVENIIDKYDMNNFNIFGTPLPSGPKAQLSECFQTLWWLTNTGDFWKSSAICPGVSAMTPTLPSIFWQDTQQIATRHCGYTWEGPSEIYEKLVWSLHTNMEHNLRKERFPMCKHGETHPLLMILQAETVPWEMLYYGTDPWVHGTHRRQKPWLWAQPRRNSYLRLILYVRRYTWKYIPGRLSIWVFQDSGSR